MNGQSGVITTMGVANCYLGLGAVWLSPILGGTCDPRLFYLLAPAILSFWSGCTTVRRHYLALWLTPLAGIAWVVFIAEGIRIWRKHDSLMLVVIIFGLYWLVCALMVTNRGNRHEFQPSSPRGTGT